MKDEDRDWIVESIDREIKKKDLIVAVALLRQAYRTHKGEEISLQDARDLINNWEDTKEKINNETLL